MILKQSPLLPQDHYNGAFLWNFLVYCSTRAVPEWSQGNFPMTIEQNDLSQ